VHLVGFIVRLYHDARLIEGQICEKILTQYPIIRNSYPVAKIYERCALFHNSQYLNPFSFTKRPLCTA